MNRRNAIACACIIVCALIVQSCAHNKADIEYPGQPNNSCDTVNMRYSVEIKAILDANCKACHQGTAITGYDLYDYATISGLALDGNFTYGTLLSAVMHKGGAPEMPQNGGKLSDCDINKITAWVNAGAPNN